MPNGRALGLAILVGLAGCAKFPSTPVDTAGFRMVVSLRTDGAIRTGQEPGSSGVPYVYIVAFRFSELDSPIDEGPLPVIGAPWGNGFVAGNATHFMSWDPTQASEYTVYQFADATLQNWTPIGVPVNFDRVETGDDLIRFEVTLGQLVPDPAARARIRSVQINFLTMDRIPLGGSGGKRWDALGDARLPSQINATVTIPLNTTGLYDNVRSGALEPRGDQSEPSLDLVDWSIDVRR